MKVEIAYDSTIFIEKSIREVRNTVFVAVILVVGVIFVFLRSLRATLIPWSPSRSRSSARSG